MFNIVQVPFYDDSLDAIKRDDGIWLVVRRACENVGIDFPTQRIKLKSAPWAVVGMIPSTGSDGKTYEMFAIHIKSVPMWLATIDVSRVGENVRAKLVRYQCEAAEVLANYFVESPKLVDPLIAQAEAALALTKEFVRLREEQVAIKKAQAEARVVQEELRTSVRALEESEASRKVQEEQAVENLRRLPSPTVTAESRTLRSLVVELVRQYTIVTGAGTYSEVWSKLYRELRYRYKFNAVERTKNRNAQGKKVSILDIIDEAGLMPQLYAIASEILIRNDSAV